MAEGILKFTLPEEDHEFQTAVKAGALASIIWSYDQVLRSKLKYENHEEKVYECLEDMRSKLYEVLDEHGICMDDLC
jgi:hypothetical protein